MNTDQLISAIVADNRTPRAFVRVFGLATLLGVAGAGVLFFTGIGPRLDFDAAVQTWRFLFKFIITAPLAVLATMAIYRMARPAWWQRTGLAIVAGPLCLLAAAALFELFAVPQSLWMVRLIGSNSENCMTLIPLLAIVPLGCFLAALRNGAPADPGLSGAVAGLAAGAIAANFYALNCFDDSPLFVVTWYPLAVGMVVAAGYLCGRRMLAW